ncbi:hypothetical protein GJ496_007518 [Pomphorhynchus laevis]|nr:hypothetical protein GJ496_007518 [Pomphorhynchus laevis]
MALRESIEDQPPHKRSRPPALLDSFEHAFAPTPPSSSISNSVNNISTISPQDSYTGNLIENNSIAGSSSETTVNAFDNSNSSTFSPGSNSMQLHSPTLNSQSSCSQYQDNRSTRPPSLNNQSATNSVSGLISPFDRCLNATTSSEDLSKTPSNGLFQQSSSVATTTAQIGSSINDLYKNIQSPLRQQQSPSQQMAVSLNGSVIGGNYSFIKAANSPSTTNSLVQVKMNSNNIPRGRSFTPSISNVQQPRVQASQNQLLYSMQAHSPHSAIQNGRFIPLSPHHQSIVNQQSIKAQQQSFTYRPTQQHPTTIVSQQGHNYQLIQNQQAQSVGNQNSMQFLVQSNSPVISPQFSSCVLPADAPRLRLLTAQMVLLLHAHKCSQRDKVSAQMKQANPSNSIEITSCQVQQCAAMKSILNHALSCNRGDVCEVQHCVSSRKLIKHWKNCNLMDCPICSPIKAAANQHSRSCKEWQKCIAPEVRSNLVAKIVVSIFPNQDKHHQKDKRMPGLVNYARKIEAEVFDAAQNQDNYFYMLAEKVYKIRKEIEERRSEINKSKQLSSQFPNVKLEKQELQPSSSAPSINVFENHINFRMPYNPDAMAGDKGPPNKVAPSAVDQQHHYDQQLESPYQRNTSRYKSVFSINPSESDIGSKENQMDKDSNLTTENALTAVESNTETEDDMSMIKEENISELQTFVKQEPPDEFTTKEECTDNKEVDAQRLEEREKINSQVLHEIFISDDSIPFRQPVDPILLNIPDYFEIIKRPMDLSTIKRKLDDLEYETPWDLIDDMWLMFTNAWTYNKKTSKIYKMCSRLSENFVQLMNASMTSIGYCCGEKRVYLPQVLFCYGNQLCSQIARDAQYFCYTNKNPVTNLTNDKYTFCFKCFENFKEDIALVGDDPNGKLYDIPKSDFQILRNDNQEMEPFVNCKLCNRKWHQVCALYHENICNDGFVCPKCKVEKNAVCRTNRYTSSRLGNNKLGQWIENRINGFLTKSGYSSLVGKVHIRVLASFDKICEIKPRMRQYFIGQMPDRLPFRSKAIFAFQELDDKEVAFFGLHVQEYDAKAPIPNSRRVYISYLDSVYFFQPKHLRTDIYHEILIGYLDWVKRLGYHWGHIWACPPSEGDDYIFYCHPPDQKTPKQKRLIDWYRKMLDKAILDRVVIEYHDIMKDVVDNDVKSLAQIPYFDGDFWPNVFEDSIKEMEEEERKAKEESEVVKDVTCTSNTLIAESDDDESMSLITSSKRCSTQKKKNQVAKSKAQRKQQSKKLAIGSDLTSKVFATMDKHKEVFFVIRLSDAPSTLSDTDDIVDVDSILPSDLMDGRDAFLNFARERHLEFSSLRRAKYSTMAFLYEIHQQGSDRFVYTCNKCKSHVEVRYHCTICEDYDLCGVCHQSVTHEHPMERLAVAIDITSVAASKLGSSADSAIQASPQQTRQQSIERCIESLLHAVNCRNANCSSHPGCQKMKLVIQHIKQCTNKTSSCQICRQIKMLCHHHARVCTDPNCSFPFCTGLKQKMQKQRALNSQLERRRMMTTMQRSMHPALTSPSSQNSSTVREIQYMPVAQQSQVTNPATIVSNTLGGKPMRTPTIVDRTLFLQDLAIQQRRASPITNQQMNFRRCPVPQPTSSGQHTHQNDMSFQQCRTQDFMIHHNQASSRMLYTVRAPSMYAEDSSSQLRPMLRSSSHLSIPENKQLLINAAAVANQGMDAVWQQNRMLEQQQHALLMRRQQQQQIYLGKMQQDRQCFDESMLPALASSTSNSDRSLPQQPNLFSPSHNHLLGQSQLPSEMLARQFAADDRCSGGQQNSSSMGQMPHSSTSSSSPSNRR